MALLSEKRRRLRRPRRRPGFGPKPLQTRQIFKSPRAQGMES